MTGPSKKTRSRNGRCGSIFAWKNRSPGLAVRESHGAARLDLGREFQRLTGSPLHPERRRKQVVLRAEPDGGELLAQR